MSSIRSLDVIYVIAFVLMFVVFSSHINAIDYKLHTLNKQQAAQQEYSEGNRIAITNIGNALMRLINEIEEQKQIH